VIYLIDVYDNKKPVTGKAGNCVERKVSSRESVIGLLPENASMGVSALTFKH